MVRFSSNKVIVSLTNRTTAGVFAPAACVRQHDHVCTARLVQRHGVWGGGAIWHGHPAQQTRGRNDFTSSFHRIFISKVKQDTKDWVFLKLPNNPLGLWISAFKKQAPTNRFTHKSQEHFPPQLSFPSIPSGKLAYGLDMLILILILHLVFCMKNAGY